MTIIMNCNLISILEGAYWSHTSSHPKEKIMSTLSLRPSLAVQLSAFAATLANFVRAKAAPGAVARSADAGDVWALYRMTRGADAVSPAVARRLEVHARSK
ncbi:hypothetical protein SOM61_00375 [Massilia sp. CFBP9012]|uniref:hypothetical protein n=1 Tax=Massilia sp. CFBP9012 TaxID=3096531 RepID=UPI002A6B686C|nr:hypothetical protein [Massilia sp. CFBP9012]MDY0973398.1 hypothetical protein [Massilia sp. CFBP9012]